MGHHRGLLARTGFTDAYFGWIRSAAFVLPGIMTRFGDSVWRRDNGRGIIGRLAFTDTPARVLRSALRMDADLVWHLPPH